MPKIEGLDYKTFKNIRACAFYFDAYRHNFKADTHYLQLPLSAEAKIFLALEAPSANYYSDYRTMKKLKPQTVQIRVVTTHDRCSDKLSGNLVHTASSWKIRKSLASGSINFALG